MKKISLILALSILFTALPTQIADVSAQVSRSAFELNSTLVKKQDFDSSSFTAGGKLNSSAYVEDVKGIETKDGFFTSTEKVSDGNLALYLERDMNKQGSSAGTAYATWNVDSVINSPYMIISYKSKSNSENDQAQFRFFYDDLTNGELVPDDDKGKYVDSWGNGGLPLYFKNDRITRDTPNSNWEFGCDNTKYFTSGQYLNAWHIYTYLIDAVARKAYLYIDDNYVMSFVIVNNRNGAGYSGDNGKFVEGIQYLEFAQARYNNATDGKIKKTYYDDFQIRKMSDEQISVLLEGDVEFDSAEITDGDKLPVVSKSYKLPITWTTDNGAVQVGADGTVYTSSAAIGKTISLNAKVGNAVIETYTVKVEGDIGADPDTEILFYEPFSYINGLSISQTAAAVNGWSVQNENTIPSGKGSTSLVMADPENRDNSVLDIETLTTAYTSANRYAQITGPFNAVGKKYLMINKKVNITTNGNNCIFYVYGNYADADTGAITSTNNMLFQFTYDMQNNRYGHELSSGYSAIASPGIVTGKWVDAKFIVDCTAQTYDVYIDNVKINTAPLDLLTKSDKKVVAGIYSIALGTNRWHKTSGHYYIDDLTISAFDEEGIVRMDSEKLEIPEVVPADFEVPIQGNFGSEITWSSSDSDIISIVGNKAYVKITDNDTDVEITATIKCGAVTETKVFKVTVLGDKDRIDDMGSKLTTYVLSGQKYVMESFTPNIPQLAHTDTVEITSSDSSVVYDKAANKVTIVQDDEDKVVNVTVKVTSAKGNSFTKNLKFYIPFASVVSYYEGFDYPSLKGTTISGADSWSHSNENSDLSKTGVTIFVEPSPDDETDLVMDTRVLRTYNINQYASMGCKASVVGDAILQANIKFGDNAANQYIWYVFGNVKTSSNESSKTLLELYLKRGDGTLTCKSNGGTATITTEKFPTNEWFNLKIVIHSTDNSFDVYKDNVKLNTTPIALADVTTGGTVTSVTGMQFGASRWNGNQGHMYVDDIMVRYGAGAVLSTEAQMLDIPDTLIYDYNLPTAGIYEGTTISWKSADESILSSEGKVNRNQGLGDTTVKLTATIESAGATYEKDFDVKVVNTPYYTIDSLVFENADGDVAYSASAAGKIKSMFVTKYTTEINDNATAYVAVYDSDDNLVLVTQPKKISQSGSQEINMPLPDVDGLYAKAFIWNSDTCKPLAYSYSTKVAENATIYTIGDSTMQSYDTIEIRQKDNNITGWAQVLPLAIKNNSVRVENKAVAGTSTLSFYNKGYIHPIYENIKPGDYLVIQFGHNDEKPWLSQDAEVNFAPLEAEHQSHPSALEVPEWARGRKTYEQWLREYAAAARMKGAQVVFATSIYRHFFDNSKASYSHYGYPEAMIDTAAETDTPVIDLCTRTGEWLDKYGEAATLKYYLAFHGGDDHTHLTYDGAVEVANMAIDEMNRIAHPIAECFATVPQRK